MGYKWVLDDRPQKAYLSLLFQSKRNSLGKRTQVSLGSLREWRQLDQEQLAQELQTIVLKATSKDEHSDALGKCPLLATDRKWALSTAQELLNTAAGGKHTAT